MENNKPEEKFDTYIKWISEGDTFWGSYARRLAKERKYSDTKRLESAIKQGCAIKFDTYIKWISEGDTFWESYARRLAKERGYGTERIEAALNPRGTTKLDLEIRLTVEGDLLKLAKQGGYDLQGLEAAINQGKVTIKVNPTK